MSHSFFRVLGFTAALAAGLYLPSDKASAELVLSHLVVELAPAEKRVDVEVLNSGSEDLYVLAEPREIINPGTKAESARIDADPEQLGLLVAPSRLILQPHQRRLLRIATLGATDAERIYRVTIKPVTAPLTASASGLKVLVGYDLLVIVRPPRPAPHVTAYREGAEVTLTNDGNVSIELRDGSACAAPEGPCSDLPGARLYAGSKKTISIGADRHGAYQMKVGSSSLPLKF